MKKLKIAALVLTAAIIMSTVAFAEQAATVTPGSGTKQEVIKKDPVQRLEDMKAKIQQSVADGKMDKAKADEMIAQLDKQIKEMNDFNALTLDQKKQKLIGDFTASINKQVQSGKLTQDKADKAIADYKAKIDKWDGTGYLFKQTAPFGKEFAPCFRGGMGQEKQDAVKKDPLQMLEDMKTKIQQGVTDGKIDQAQADKQIAQIDQQIKELKDFNALTLDQKKQKLINDFTANVNQQVKDGKLTQDKADKTIADYKAKIDKWDGTGYPFGGLKGILGKEGFGMKGFGMRGSGEKPGQFQQGKRGFGGFKGRFGAPDNGGNVQKQRSNKTLKPATSGSAL